MVRGSTSNSGCQGRGGSSRRQGFAVPITWVAESGRHDTRLAILAGLKYQFNESVEAKILAGYENRASTIASRASDKFVVGASIDFDFDFMRPRWPGSR